MIFMVSGPMRLILPKAFHFTSRPEAMRSRLKERARSSEATKNSSWNRKSRTPCSSCSQRISSMMWRLDRKYGCRPQIGATLQKVHG